MDAKKLLIEQVAREFAGSRKVLAVVPSGQVEWRPHERSMTLGRLAGHIAEAAEWGVWTMSTDHLKLEALDHKPKIATNGANAIAFLDEHEGRFLGQLRAASDEDLSTNWKMSYNGEVYVDCPRYEALQTWVINHMIHHRGQLSVYLRLLGLPVPGVYGPSADEG